ncbi:MAG: mechanosensitive ion channel family protein [Candidatus Promineofilum sp.]|jgi:small-conductance mechanosensitive channel|nr:mechanosensitive ion channel family protein [Promineifilum sp.]
MNASRARRLFLLAALLAAIVIVPAARAQEDDRAPVRLDGRTLFRVGPSGELDAAARARRVELRLEALLDSPEVINPAVVELAETDTDERLITVNAAPIVTVTAADADENLTSVEELADRWAGVIDDALIDARARRSARPEVLVVIEAAFVRLAESARTVLPRALATFLILALFGLIAWLVRGLLTRLFAIVIQDRTTENLIRQIVYYAIWVLGFIIAVNALGFDPQALATGLGLSSLALGFALKDILSNFVSGLLILVMRPFELGDEIVVGDTEGSVEGIDLRATQIRTYDGRIVLVPNAELFTLRVTNNTATPTRRGSLVFPLGYDNDLPRVMEIMKQAIAETPGVLTKPPNTIIVREFTDADIILELRFWTESTRRDFLDAASHVAQSVVAALKREGIPLPEADLRYLQWWDDYRRERGIVVDGGRSVGQ